MRKPPSGPKEPVNGSAVAGDEGFGVGVGASEGDGGGVGVGEIVAVGRGVWGSSSGW